MGIAWFRWLIVRGRAVAPLLGHPLRGQPAAGGYPRPPVRNPSVGVRDMSVGSPCGAHLKPVGCVR